MLSNASGSQQHQRLPVISSAADPDGHETSHRAVIEPAPDDGVKPSLQIELGGVEVLGVTGWSAILHAKNGFWLFRLPVKITLC